MRRLLLDFVAGKRMYEILVLYMLSIYFSFEFGINQNYLLKSLIIQEICDSFSHNPTWKPL
jgi:hypothetical protein